MIWDTDWTAYCRWCVDGGHRCSFAGFSDWMRGRKVAPVRQQPRQYRMITAEAGK